MPASVWSGYLTFGLISMPVRLSSGARSKSISFHMLHRDDLSRIKQQLWCPTDERVVGRDEIVKGYEYRKGEYVVIEPEDIKKIEPKTAKAMEILQFVSSGDIDPIYFESSYFLTPEEAGKRPYALLARAMRESQHMAIAKLTMHNREYTVFLRPFRDGLMLHTMYYADEVRVIEDFGVGQVEIKETELKIANQLIQALEANFNPDAFHDTFQDNLKEMIKARLEGKEVAQVEKPGKPAPVGDLMEALKQSLAQMGTREATGKKPPSSAGKELTAATSKKSPARTRARKTRAA